VSSQLPSIYKTGDDLKKTARIVFTIPQTGSLSLNQDDSWYPVADVDFVFELKLDVRSVEVQHQLLGDKAMISSARVHDHDFLVAQTNVAKEARVVVDRKLQRKPPRKAKPKTR
jgi:hypothetical protein